MGKKIQIPHTYVIVFAIIVFAAVLTWIIPGGEFAREKVMVNGTQREVVVNNSFHYVENAPQTWQIFSAFFDGFVNTADIIVFILMIGGAFWIVNDSKAIDIGILSFLNFTQKLEHWRIFRLFSVESVIITLIMLLFSFFGAIFGMSEETIAFIIIFVPLAISMGYDSIVGISLCFVGAALGFAGALLNPFTIGIAQGLSHIPLFSGIEYRIFSWLIINIVGISYVLRYARKVKLNPQSSPVYADDAYWRTKEQIDITQINYHTPVSAWVVYILLGVILSVYAFLYPSTLLKIGNNSFHWNVFPVLAVLWWISGYFSVRKTVHFFILHLVMFTILLLLTGVMGYQWYVKEIATLFFAMGIFAGIANNSHANKIVKDFIDGAKDILSAALVVGLAGGIIVILRDGKIIDTLLYYISESMSDFGKIASISMMYLFQTILNIAIPSGSGKAALTMPMMSQFSDLIGISRQATVMAFQFGDGFTNMITPTSGVLIGVLGVAKIPYEKWFRWVLPFIILLTVTGWLLLLPTVLMDLKGF